MGCFQYNGLELCLIGHASVKISNEDKKIFIDPYANLDSELYDYADYVLITHEHFDHCSPDALKKIYREGSKIIVPKGSKCSSMIKKIYPNAEILELSEGDKVVLDGVSVEAVPAYNIDKPYHPRGLGVGYVIEIKGTRIYHPGDTDFIPEMKELAGKVDIFFVPISGIYVMDEFEASEAVKAVRPKIAIPMHYNYLEGLEKDAEEFAKMIKDICEVEILLD